MVQRAPRVASRAAYQKLRDELIGFSHVRDVIVEGRTLARAVPSALAQHSTFTAVYDEYDVFLIIVDELTEEMFDAIPNSWHWTPIEVILNGSRKRLM